MTNVKNASPTQKHTPTPWFKWSANQIKSEAGGWQASSIAETIVYGKNSKDAYDLAEANAAFIVRACNAFVPTDTAIDKFLCAIGHISGIEDARRVFLNDLAKARGVA